MQEKDLTTLALGGCNNTTDSTKRYNYNHHENTKKRRTESGAQFVMGSTAPFIVEVMKNAIFVNCFKWLFLQCTNLLEGTYTGNELENFKLQLSHLYGSWDGHWPHLCGFSSLLPSLSRHNCQQPKLHPPLPRNWTKRFGESQKHLGSVISKRVYSREFTDYRWRFFGMCWQSFCKILPGIVLINCALMQFNLVHT